MHSIADIYDLPSKREELLALDRIGEKTLDRLFAQIEASKRRPLRQLLVGLSIRHVGGETARDLAVHFGEMAALQAATVEEIEGDRRHRARGRAGAARVPGRRGERPRDRTPARQPASAWTTS